MTIDKITCANLSGAAKELCQIESFEVLDDSMDGVWECVEEEALKDPKVTKESLEKQANVGFIADQSGMNRFTNDLNFLETEEKLNFAYDDPKYYHCLAENDFPVPFAMDDFDPKTKDDAAEKTAMHRSLDTLIAKGKEGLSKKIYTRSLSAYNFYDDCQPEGEDFNAVRYDCGRCSESSAVMYHQLKYAGLDPRFLYVHDIKPSMEWFSLLERIAEPADHVLVGVPEDGSKRAPGAIDVLKKMFSGGGSDLTQIDLLNKHYPANFDLARELTPRSFSGMWSINRYGDLVDADKMAEAENALKTAIRTTPDSIVPYFLLFNFYIEQKQFDNAKYIAANIQRKFGNDHPWVPVISKMSYALDPNERVRDYFADLLKGMSLPLPASVVNQFISTVHMLSKWDNSCDTVLRQFDNAEEFSKEDSLMICLSGLAKTVSSSDPYMAGYFSSLWGSMLAKNVDRYFSAVKADPSKASAIEAKQMENLSEMAADTLTYSLIQDPNNMFAFDYLSKIFRRINDPRVGISVYGELLKIYPKHTPFMTARIELLIKRANDRALSDESRAAIMTQIENEMASLKSADTGHPRVNEMAATFETARSNNEGVFSEMAQAVQKYRDRGEKLSLDLYSFMAIQCVLKGDVEGARQAVDESISVYGKTIAPALAMSVYKNFSWSFGPKERKVIDDDVSDGFDMDAEQKRLVTNIMRSLEVICERLGKYKDARGYVDLIRADGVPYVLLMDSYERGSRWLKGISNASSDGTQQVLASGFERVGNLMGEALTAIPLSIMDRMERSSHDVEGVLSKKYVQTVYSMKLGALWQYTLLTNKRGAADVLSEIPDQLVMPGLLSSVLKLIKFGGVSKKNTERLYFALDLIANNKAKITPDVQGKIIWCMDEFAKLADKHGMVAEAAKARGWISALKN